MWRSVQRWALVMVAAELAAGCRPREAAPATVTPEASPEAPPRRSGRRAAAVSPVVAAANSPVQLLPDTTPVVFTAAGVTAVLGLVDLGEILDRYRAQYEQVAQEVTRVAGVNLLDPSQWDGVGLDAAGPMGVALVDAPSETMVAFVTLTDRDKFRALIDRMSRSTMLPVLEDRGLVLRSDPSSSFSIVLRDRYAFAVTVEREARATYDFARALATIDPARGLTSSPRFQRAMASNEPARPLTAYVDVWGLFEAELGRSMQAEGREPSWAEQEFERAQAGGASADELQRLRQQIDDDRRWEEQRRQRQQAQYDVMGRWFREVEPLVFEFTASPAGLVGRVRAKMPESAVWRALVRNQGAPPAVLAALGERPVFVVGGSLDPLQAKATLDDVMRADGDDPAMEYAKFKAETGVDLEAEVLPILTGSGGFALTVSDALLRGDYKRSEQEVGFAAVVGVSSAERAAALVERVVQRVPRAKLGKDRKTGAFTLEIPDYRTVYAAVAGGHVIVTTDPGVIGRVVSGARGAGAKAMAAAAVPVVTTRDAAGQLMFDLLYPVFLWMGRRPGQGWQPRPEEPYAMFPDASHAKVDAVPKSRAYKAKFREWEAVDAKIRREEEATERRQTKTVTAVAEAVGVQAWHLRELPDGLVLEGGHFFGKGGLTRAIELVAEYFAASRGSEKIWELHSARSAVEDELRRIRVVDVARGLGVPTPYATP